MRAILMGAFSALTLLMSAGASAADSPLGTPAEQAGRFSTNYAEVVRAAMPRIDAAGLARVMEGVAKAAAAEKPLAIGNERDLEKFFGLRERGKATPDGYVDASEAVYKLNVDSGRIWVSWRRDFTPVPRTTFAGQVKEIKEAHAQLAQKLGIPREEIMFTDFREILSQTDGHPRIQQGKATPIMSEGATTMLLRSVGGVLVEGSQLRVSSVSARELALVDVRWPMVRIPDEAIRNLRDPREVLEPIIKRVAEHNKGQAVSVRMAVVLRPVEPAKLGQFVPALKIGIEPKSVKTEDGFRTDAGEVYYADLLKGRPPFVDQDQSDTAQSSEN